MFTSFIYHAFGLHGYQYLRTFYTKGKIFFTLNRNPNKIRCSDCGSSNVILKGTKTRYFKTIPVGKKQIIIIVIIQRVQCKDCSCLKQINLQFADSKKSYTRSFARYALELLKFSTIKDVARHLHVSWDMIKEIEKDYLQKHFSKPKLNDLSQIAIDEITIGRHHKYFTIVLDLITGAVVFIGDGKGADSLEPFWKKLRQIKSQIKAVAIDMSPAYIQAVNDHLSNAVIVFDHFHIVKYYNDRLSELGRELYYETTNYLHSQTLKGLRWILLKNPENLKDQNEKEQLEKALRINKPLATAY